MTAYELLDLSISIGNRIDLQLSVFITVHLAIFGGIVYVDRPLRSTEKVASLLLYSVFAALNLRIMQTQLGLDESIAREIGKRTISARSASLTMSCSKQANWTRRNST